MISRIKLDIQKRNGFPCVQKCVVSVCVSVQYKNYNNHNPQINPLPVQEFVNNERRYGVVKRSYLKILPCTGHNKCIIYVMHAVHTRKD